MAVKFLSPEWAEQLTATLNARDSFKAAAAGKAARLQQVITGDAESRYWIVIDDGTIDMGVGDLAPPVDASRALGAGGPRLLGRIHPRYRTPAAAIVTQDRHAPPEGGALAKAASGAVEWVPFVKVTNLARALDEIRGYGFTILGLDSEAGLAIEQARAPAPVALVLGAEGKGLRRLTRGRCDSLVRLDLPGPIKSLNVSNAAALALYALGTRSRAN